MLSMQSPISGNQTVRPKSSRKPLQPKNIPATPTDNLVKKKPKQEWIEISLLGDSNKENCPMIISTPTKIEPFDTSLAEELSAIRKKMERLRLDKEKTEKMLRERDLVLDMEMEELEKRGKAQRKLEIEVEKMQRLKELRSSCMRIAPIQSLREMEQGKKIDESQLQEEKSEEKENLVAKSEPVDQSVEQNPICV